MPYWKQSSWCLDPDDDPEDRQEVIDDPEEAQCAIRVRMAQVSHLLHECQEIAHEFSLATDLGRMASAMMSSFDTLQRIITKDGK